MGAVGNRNNPSSPRAWSPVAALSPASSREARNGGGREKGGRQRGLQGVRGEEKEERLELATFPQDQCLNGKIQLSGLTLLIRVQWIAKEGKYKGRITDRVPEADFSPSSFKKPIPFLSKVL